MKKIVWGIVFLLMAGMVGAIVYVTNIDWNQHKDKIAEQFYNSTGKRVNFDGKLSFKIFPSPYLNAADAKVYNTEDRSKKPLLEIKNVVAELALMPLLKGEFHVKKMTLDEVIINIDWSDEGLSWQGDLSPDQRQMMENTNMILNSVSLKNAELNFEDAASGINFRLDNLNGEIFAESIFGPFRIEGNYIKGNSPEGFALSIGKLSESLATTLNAVVTHPLSESYVRFDGSFHLINRVLNGSVIVESQKISDFVNANVKNMAIPAEYNQPLALGFDIVLNRQKMSLANIVIKYGDTQGAGVLEVMPNTKTNIAEINSSFNFSDLILDPIVDLAKEKIKQYKDNFNPQYKVDLFASIKAVRATYQGEGMKDLEADVSFYDNIADVENLAVVLPGNTSVKLTGNVYPYENQLYYQADIGVDSNDFAQTLDWLKIVPKADASAVYKKMAATAKVSGNLDKLQISPFKATLDKTTLSGEAGIVMSDRKDIMLVVDADAINLDNYISQMPEEEKQKSWTDRMIYRFKKLGWLNNIDLVANTKVGLLIYEGMPFENVDFKGNVLNGEMEIEYAKVEKMANTDFELAGKMRGFGNQPEVEDLQYKINSTDVAALINKLELDVADLDYKKFNTMNLSGTINGNFDGVGINTQIVLGNLSGAYQGTAIKEAGKLNYDGSLEVRHPDFATLLENIKAQYEPGVKNLGLFRLNTQIKGSKDNFELSNMSANIGYTSAEGKIDYNKLGERPKINAQLEINKLELEKFLPKGNSGLINAKLQDETPEFLPKPFWSRDKIDYSAYKGVEAEAVLDVKELSYKKYLLKDAKVNFKTNGSLLEVNELAGVYNEAPVTASGKLNMQEDPAIDMGLKISNAKVNNFGLGGKVYNLKDGIFSAAINLSSKAASEQDFVENLAGQGEFRAENTTVGGMGLKNIYDDLLKREQTEGLVENIRQNIGQGSTTASLVVGNFKLKDGNFELENAAITTDDADVKVTGNGNLATWEMDVMFDTKYKEPKYLPGFAFSLKSNMENPLVDVDVSSLFRFYETKEQQRQEALQAEADAQKAQVDALIKEQKNIADKLVGNTRDTLEKDIDNKMSSAFSTGNVNKYNVLKQEIAKTLAELVEATNNVSEQNADEEAVRKLKEVNAAAAKSIELFGQQRDAIYLDDLQKINETKAAEITETDNKLKQMIFSYNSKVEQYKGRVAKIITDYKLESDEQFNSAVAKVDNDIAGIEKAGDRTQMAESLRKDNATIKDFEQNNAKLEGILETMKNNVAALEKDITNLTSYAEAVISDQEKAYAEKLKRQEEQRQVEENTGTISIKKTGKTVTVVRDIEEIKNAEAKINNDEVKVLDFSKEKSPENKEPETPKENVIKKGRNIIIN